MTKPTRIRPVAASFGLLLAVTATAGQAAAFMAFGTPPLSLPIGIVITVDGKAVVRPPVCPEVHDIPVPTGCEDGPSEGVGEWEGGGAISTWGGGEAGAYMIKWCVEGGACQTDGHIELCSDTLNGEEFKCQFNLLWCAHIIHGKIKSTCGADWGRFSDFMVNFWLPDPQQARTVVEGEGGAWGFFCPDKYQSCAGGD